MFLLRALVGDSREDEMRTAIQHAIEADEAGQYDQAVELYANAIEKMMNCAQQLSGDEQTQLRSKIHDYMSRAEYLKKWLNEQRNIVASNTKKAPLQSKENRNISKHRRKDTQYAHTILDEVMDRSPAVTWNDISGLDLAKQVLQEAVIYPTLRPDLFTGLRSPPRGVLLFGPPGTGKTLLAKAVATESSATFFNISASTLTSKWVGEGEKLVRALFEMARELQPAVVFLDEVDALLGSRSSSENDASRRIKNQFFMELDGAASSQDDRILVMAATNLPQELDDAIIRRLEKRIYVPLPEAKSREGLLRHLLQSQPWSMSSREMNEVVQATQGYSGSDLKALCKDAALGPIRALGPRLAQATSKDVRPIHIQDFRAALQRVRPSVSKESLRAMEEWNDEFGISA